MKLPALREIIEERKGKAIENLAAVYAENRLPLEEYERLVGYIDKIESERELAVVEKIVAEYGGPAAEDEDAEDEAPPDTPYGHGFGGYSMAMLSSRTINGPVPQGAQFMSILGSEHINIRREDLRRRRTALQVVSILGDCVIFVEPGIRVANEAVPLLGGTWTDHKVGKAAKADGPELVINGTALLGNITVKLLKK
jgi:hypothetical protein